LIGLEYATSLQQIIIDKESRFLESVERQGKERENLTSIYSLHRKMNVQKMIDDNKEMELKHIELTKQLQVSLKEKHGSIYPDGTDASVLPIVVNKDIGNINETITNVVIKTDSDSSIIRFIRAVGDKTHLISLRWRIRHIA